jgi:hypothetical protein
VIDPPRRNYILRACAANHHAWHALCECGGAKVCLRCGVGAGTIPCQCMVPRWSVAELVTRTLLKESDFNAL